MASFPVQTIIIEENLWTYMIERKKLTAAQSRRLKPRNSVNNAKTAIITRR